MKWLRRKFITLLNPLTRRNHQSKTPPIQVGFLHFESHLKSSRQAAQAAFFTPALSFSPQLDTTVILSSSHSFIPRLSG